MDSYSNLTNRWANAFQGFLHTELPAEQPYLIGFHFRHALATQAPIILLRTRDSKDNELESARDTFTRNEQLALHTVNHVLDSLFYDKSHTDKNIALCIRATFAMDPSCHYFDVEQNEIEGTHKNEQANRCDTCGRTDSPVIRDYWRGKCGSVAQERDAIAGLFLGKGYDFKFARLGVRTAVLRDGLSAMTTALLNASSDIDAASIMFSSPSHFYSQFVCGAQKLCDELLIEPSVVTYRSIMAAVYQLATYAHSDDDGFGTEAIVLMIRSKQTFGHTIGFTLITKSVLSTDTVNKCATKLLDLFNTPGSTENDYLMTALHHETFKRLGYRFTSVVASDTSTAAIIPQQLIVGPLKTFLEACSHFCDEQLEGRSLRFGLMLSNAGLMRYWPGPAPLLLAFQSPEEPDELFPNESSDHPCRLENLPKLVHLLEGPEDRCLVFPYRDKDYFGEKIPFEELRVLELTDFQEAFSTWVDAELWSPDHRPYAYFTDRYPWCYAAVVGPYSEIRVFRDGTLVAYRNGKGWNRRIAIEFEIARRSMDNSEAKIPSSWRNSFSSEETHGAVLKGLISLSVQMSHLGRCGGHGGFLVYIPEETDTVKVVPDPADLGQGSVLPFWRWFEQSTTRMPDYEPKRWTSNGPTSNWLTGQRLFRRGEGGHLEMDRNVAQLVLRASALDGAIIFNGEGAQITHFARKLNFSSIEALSKARPQGTKRGSAEAFVRKMAESGCEKAFAITVSSDGPVRLYFPPDRKSNDQYHLVKPIEIFARDEEGKTKSP
ncbi:MAG: hypothetical protein MN733_02875 [Nitrososphaera sp.]|nr:hypothetical protein [Nitrososphaera sp.]